MNEIKHIRKYYFSEIIAKDVGVDEAIMLNNIYFWVVINRRNNHNHEDGRYWTYNSVEDFTKQFPFWSAGQIRRILNNLKTEGYIDTGRYNRFGYDKTKWYTTTEKATTILGNDKVIAEISKQNDWE